MSKMNLPNKLSILRLCLVPICIFAVLLPAAWVNPYVSGVIAAVVFIFTAITDMLDGKIARRHGLITDFGKFIDALRKAVSYIHEKQPEGLGYSTRTEMGETDIAELTPDEEAPLPDDLKIDIDFE